MCAIYTSIQTKIAYYRYTFIIKANTTNGTNKRTKQTNNGYADGYSTSREADREIDSQ